MKTVRRSRRRLLKAAAIASASVLGCRPASRPTAVLTFDDAVRSHRHFVAPYLADLGFGATFFVTHRWMDDRENFMSWDEIAEIAEMGFEIGNHSWSHANFAVPKHAARLEGELALVENELARVGVDRPVSFAWCGNRFGPEGVKKLRSLGYRLARRGLTPDLPEDHSPEAGAAYDPVRHDRLLIPTTGNSVPGTRPEHFRRILDRAEDGIVVLQFHGVPDIAHPWVHTSEARFRECMDELKDRGFRVLALRDLLDLVQQPEPGDPNVSNRNPGRGNVALEEPVELVQTRFSLARWTDTMARHGYTVAEASEVAGLSAGEAAGYERKLASRPKPPGGRAEVLPYPGGRHPRVGFLEGAIDPLRGTKASVFIPGDPESYVVVDLPELITSDRGHLFLAHTHVPTIWNDQNVWLDNVDWTPTSHGGLELEWVLPNGVSFGSAVRPDGDGAAMDLWLRNGLDEPLSGLRTQLCVMLKGARGFDELTLANKIFEPPVAAVRSRDGRRWILAAWGRCGRCWGNQRCPCLHSDPVFPDCQPGRTVRLTGRLWFFEGDSVDGEIARAKREFEPLAGIRGTARGSRPKGPEPFFADREVWARQDGCKPVWEA